MIQQKHFLKSFVGVPLSGPFENVEIYFSKIDRMIFASETIFVLQNPFILTKLQMAIKSSILNFWMSSFEWDLQLCNMGEIKRPRLIVLRN